MNKLLLTASVLFCFLCSKAQIAIYDVNSSGLINMVATGVCAPTDWKPPNTGDTWGIQWNSTNPATPSSVRVQFYQTFQSGSASFPTFLNGMLDSIWTPFDYTCVGFIQTFDLNPANYNPGGLNQFTVDFSFNGNCLIDENQPDWPAGIYARVTVDYSSPTSVDEMGEGELSIYPNPSDGLFNLIPGNGIHIQSVRLIDLAGRSSLIELSGTLIDLRDQASGIYTVQVITNQGIVNKQVILK